RVERPLPVEARIEQLVRLGEEAQLLLGSAATRYVGDDRHGGYDLVVSVAHRGCTDLEGARAVVPLQLSPLGDRHLAGLDRALERPAARADLAMIGAECDQRTPDALALVVAQDDVVV